jgi:hypothetical protein
MRWGIFILMSLFFLSFVSAEIPTNCPDSMIAYWKLDGDATDSFNGHDGQVSGSIEWDPLKIGQSATFFGNEKISIADHSTLDLTNGFTIQFWSLRTFFPIPQEGDLIKKSNYQVKFASDNKIQAVVSGSTLSSGTLSTETPYFITLTGNKNSRVINLYVNGELEDSVTLSSWFSETSDPLYFGEGFKGLMDEIAFYDSALNEEEILSLYEDSNVGKDYCYLESGEGSETQTDFTIQGCPLNGGSLSAGACSSNGEYFCSLDQVLYETLNDPYGCSRGLSTAGSNWCCPTGYFCNDTGEPICTQMTWECSDFKDKGECEDNWCYWIGTDSDGFCTADIKGMSCSIYPNEQSCELDAYNLGQEGYGTEVCGEYFFNDTTRESYVIPFESCRCEWQTDDTCDLTYNTTQEIYGTTPDSFKCNKDFFVGDCIDGEQIVNWTALAQIKSGYDSGIIPQWILEETKCVNGTSTRFCGEEIIKTPGFGGFGFMTALLAIIIFHIFRLKSGEVLQVLK